MKKRNEAPGNRVLFMLRKTFPVVTEVEDAKDDLVVTVTPRDVSYAAKKAHSHCAMARACEREMSADAAVISVTRVFLIYGQKAVRYAVSQHTAREIVAFDRGGEFSAGDYTLRAPRPYEALGKTPTPPKGRPGKSTHAPRQVTAGIRARVMGATK